PDNRRASRNCLYVRTCRPFLRGLFAVGIGAYMKRTCPFGISLRYIASIIFPPYIIGWLFVVNTFSAIAGYFLLSRAITSNANFSDIVCGVLILCSELISTNLSICAFLLLKYVSSATISCIISLLSISSANCNNAKLSLKLTLHSSTILRKSHSLLISRFIIAVFIRLSTIGGSPFPLNIV